MGLKALLFSPVISDLIDPADQEENAIKKNHYNFKECQKELAKKKTGPFNGGPVNIWAGQYQLQELYNGNN